MITGNEIYWITRCDYFHSIGWIFGVIGAVFCAIMTIGILVCMDDDEEDGMKWCASRLVPAILLTLLLWCAYAFIPTTKEMCAIKAIPMVVNNEGMQQLPEKVLELANEWMEELRPKGTEKITEKSSP